MGLKDYVNHTIRKPGMIIFIWESICTESNFHISVDTKTTSMLWCFDSWRELELMLEEKRKDMKDILAGRKEKKNTKEEIFVLETILASKDEIMANLKGD